MHVEAPAGGRPVIFAGHGGGSELRMVLAAGADRVRYEQDLADQGIALPFGARVVTGSLPEYARNHFVAVIDVNDVCVAGFAIQSRRAPVIPGHYLYRIEHFASAMPPQYDDFAVAALSKWVRNQRNVLRISVDVFSFDQQRRETVGALFSRNGFRRPEVVNGYVETVITDLSRSEQEMFAGLHHSARRKVRQVQKGPVTVGTVDDITFAPRMNSLMQETMARTGGTFRHREWERRIELSRAQPDASRIVGLFRTDASGPASLLAYAWGCHCGDFAFYSEAASTRDTGELRLPLAYAVMWDLMVWAKRAGARWFDLGGITHGAHGSDDPLGGISDFKRYFSQQVVTVRDEWILDNHSWRASLAAHIHRRALMR